MANLFPTNSIESVTIKENSTMVPTCYNDNKK